TRTNTIGYDELRGLLRANAGPTIRQLAENTGMDGVSSRVALLTCILMIADTRFLSIGNVDNHSRRHHPYLSKSYGKKSDLIETEYVGIDQHGQAYVNCTYKMDGVVGVRKCSMPPSDTTFDMGFACFALWSSEGEIIAQDCWIHQELSLEQCQKNGCNHAKAYGVVNFCCCFGHQCNGKLDM
ncbi:hypothetical protein Angca_001735, partial [Angiostrongylus cantonensis]